MKYNLAASDVFPLVVKMINHTRLRFQTYLILSKFAFITSSMAFEFMVLGLFDFVWLLSYLQPEWNFLNHLITVINYVFTFCTTSIFLCFCGVMAQFETLKHVPKLDYVAYSSMQLRNLTQLAHTEILQNVLLLILLYSAYLLHWDKGSENFEKYIAMYSQRINQAPFSSLQGSIISWLASNYVIQ